MKTNFFIQKVDFSDEEMTIILEIPLEAIEEVLNIKIASTPAKSEVDDDYMHCKSGS